jgi:ubiquinone/menaquinone biosynthesis C-methylase UbiE
MMNPAEFDNIARSEESFWWFRGMRRILFALLDEALAGRPPGRALEAGCGIGYFAREFQRRYGWPVAPVDLGWQGLQYARRLTHDKLVQADVAHLPFPAAAFDAVLSLDVIVHFPRGLEETPVREMARVLKPGGLLVLRVAALDILRSRHSEFAHERQRFTRGRLRQLVESAGFRVERTTYANTFLVPVALAKFRLWEPLLRQAPASGTAPIAPWLNALLSIPLAAEAALLARGLNLPVGQSLILLGVKRG